MRYVNTGNVGVNVSRNQLLSSFGIGYAANSAYRLPSAVLVKKVCVYDQPNSLGSLSSQISLTWQSQYSPEKMFSDQSSSIYAARIESRPPKDSTASFWSVDANNEAEILFSVSATLGAIIDVHCQILLQNDFIIGNVGTIMTFTSGALVGGITYYTYLDKISSGGAGVWKPVAVTTSL
jgi:hypothetical protein